MDGDERPFLFINEGAAVLSTSAFGTAVIKDLITQREIQVLKHTGICYLLFPAVLVDVHVRSPRSPSLCDGASYLCLGSQIYSLLS